MMNLRLIREPSIDGATFGTLFVDKHWLCHTIEDEIRERDGVEIDDWKVPGATAIPQGRYHILITHSRRFNRPLPLLLNVKGFDGIRIHPGNGPLDTEGCILPGMERWGRKVLRPIVAFGFLFEKIQDGVKGRGSQALLDLQRHHGIWVRISGADRVTLTGPPYDDVMPMAQALLGDQAEHVLWGSDWPHSGYFEAGRMPDDGQLYDFLVRATESPARLAKVLVDNPAMLFS